jgi:anti-sigma-K factor RskA
MNSGHAEFLMTGAYALGSLDIIERDAFEAHLRTCASCQEEVRSLRRVTLALAAAAPERTPRAALRERVLEYAQAPTEGGDFGRVASGLPPEPTVPEPHGVAPGAEASGWARDERRSNVEIRPTDPSRMRRWHVAVWLPAAALIAVAVGLGAHAQTLRNRIVSLESRLAIAVRNLDAARASADDARRDAMRVQNAMSVLASSDMARIELVGQTVAPSASARAFWSRSRGLVFTARDLPALPEGKVYQVWVLTGGAPISAGLVVPDSRGETTALFETESSIPQPAGVAVSLEPGGGVPAPTGAIYLVGRLGT